MKNYLIKTLTFFQNILYFSPLLIVLIYFINKNLTRKLTFYFNILFLFLINCLNFIFECTFDFGFSFFVNFIISFFSLILLFFFTKKEILLNKKEKLEFLVSYTLSSLIFILLVVIIHIYLFGL
jgi:hypothetical protein